MENGLRDEIRNTATDIHEILPPAEWGEAVIYLLECLADEAYQSNRLPDLLKSCTKVQEKLTSWQDGMEKKQ